MFDDDERPTSEGNLTPIKEEDSVVPSPSIYSMKHLPEDMDELDSPIQQRLYIINRSGSGEAQYVLLNKDRTEFASYSVRLDTWRIIKNIAHFGVVVIDNVMYIIGGYDQINCKHLHRVLR